MNKDITFLLQERWGIGNTTTSTALASILLNLKPEAVTGRGAGLDDSGLKRKVEVITKAKEMYGRYADNPLKLLQSIGGLDIAGLVGVYIGGAVYGIPVVADGVIATVAALIAVKLQPRRLMITLLYRIREKNRQ